MALKALRLIEVEGRKVNVVEFRSFMDLRDYVKGKSGEVDRSKLPPKRQAEGKKKLISNALQEAVQKKKKSKKSKTKKSD